MKKKYTLIVLLLAVITLLSACSKQPDEDKKKDTAGDSLSGEYQGLIQVPDQPLNIQVTLEKEKEWIGTISIPVQGIQDYPLSNVNISDPDVYFAMIIQGQTLTFTGERENETITGTFTQNGMSFPFELTKQNQTSSPSEEEAEQFLSVNTDHGTLYGELELPDGNGPHPVVLIIPGSGPTDRNGNTPTMPGKNNSLKMLAEELAEQGVASVRYDKRGAGKNHEAAIPEEDTRFEHFIHDAVAWVQLLKTDERFSKVGILGHSQGSLVGMAAAEIEGADLFISIAGAGQPVDQVLDDQLKESLPEHLYDESKTILARLKRQEAVEDISQELYSVFRPSILEFLTSWMQYDPAEEIRKLDIPVLIIQGTNDIQVSEKEARTLHEASPQSKLLIIEGMNHVLKEAPANREDNVKTYSDPELPLSDGLISGIIDFLQREGFLEK